jgi:hypothetical protein
MRGGRIDGRIAHTNGWCPMIRRWIDRWRRGTTLRSAADLQDWLTSIESVVAMCSSSLREKEIPSDIGVTLDRVDRELMRFRNHAAEVRRPLRQHSVALAARVAQTTDQVFHLRNLTCAFLLRWQSVRQTDPSADRALTARREMEEARLQASESARSLAAVLESLAPEVRTTISLWVGTE